VRILLGNYPVVSNLQWGSQIEDVLTDLRQAGVEKMVDPAIGWRLEVANFPGTYPHSHTKFVVIDGERVAGAGFNYGYLHLPKDHPSGKGYDLMDLGLLIVGPVAQEAIGVYDDMWTGANQIYCEDFFPADGSDWKDTCKDLKGVADHVPEVQRYYLPPDGKDNTFSLYRNSVFKEGDEFIAASIAAAQGTIDMMEVNFSLEMICMVNVVFPDVCTIDDALPWMDALLQTIEKNQTRVRVMMENTNSNGLENRVAANVLMDELKRRGLDHLVELRFYKGKIHAKSLLIDDQMLIIGSQNMHYSSWGESGLNEYSLATDNPQAVHEYKALFETKWQQAIPFKEAEYGTSP
jgi:phosphatidylserine/phosphatidylglycerophosphate/cardiolipin synthase-like enzyme